MSASAAGAIAVARVAVGPRCITFERHITHCRCGRMPIRTALVGLCVCLPFTRAAADSREEGVRAWIWQAACAGSRVVYHHIVCAGSVCVSYHSDRNSAPAAPGSHVYCQRRRGAVGACIMPSHCPLQACECVCVGCPLSAAARARHTIKQGIGRFAADALCRVSKAGRGRAAL